MPQTAEELCKQVAAMPPGGVAVLSQAHFGRIFGSERSLEARKREAVVLGERCGCGVLFIGTDDIFVRFTRRQIVGAFRRP